MRLSVVSAAGLEPEAFSGRLSPLPKSRAQPRDLNVVSAAGLELEAFSGRLSPQPRNLNVVSAAGLEPATHALKGHCSTN
jgi:hypothetical protein